MEPRRLNRPLVFGVAIGALAVAGVEWFDTGAARDDATDAMPEVRAPAGSRIARVDPGIARVMQDEVPGPSAASSRALLSARDRRKAGLAAVVGLAETPGLLSEATLADVALSHTDPAVRVEAVHALGERDGPIVLAALQQALQDSNSRVRESAVRAFADVGGDAAALGLSPALSAAETAMRLDAVDALAEIGGADATRFLHQALEDQDPRVREAAAQYLAERHSS